MTNPWLKKNPFMSLWLSSANKVMGRARGRATAAVKREAGNAGAAAHASSAAVHRVLDQHGRQAASGRAQPPHTALITPRRPTQIER